MKEIKFKVIPFTQKLGSYSDIFILKENNWDDWFEFETTYELFYYDANKEQLSLGFFKIGEKGQDTRRPAIPLEFNYLESNFFSLGLTSAR